MTGLELAERYYEEYGRPLVARHFAAHQDRIAAGLVGEGSECFGFDDELSRDHDWGPGFCLWLTAGDDADIGAELQMSYDAMPKSFAGHDGGLRALTPASARGSSRSPTSSAGSCATITCR